MADRILCLSWGRVVSGREAHSLEVFNDAVNFYGGLRRDGQIEDVDLVLFGVNGGDVDGMMQIRGSHAQLDAMREKERFQRIVIDAQLVVEQLRIAEGYLNEGIATPMSYFQEATAALPHPVGA
jgi:hypothetical protein